MKKFIMPVLAGAMVMTLAACGQKEPSKIEKIKTAGELRIAICDAHSTNCEYDEASNTYTGVESEFASFIAEDMGVSATFVQMNLEDAKTSLNDGSVDIAIGNINNESDYLYNFGVSSSYGNGYLYCVTQRGVFVNTFDSMSGLNVCNYSRLSPSTKNDIEVIENVTVTESEDLKNVETKLLDGSIDAYMCYEYQAKELINNPNLQAQNIVGANIERLVVLNNVNDSDLTNEVNSALQKYALKRAEEKALEEAENSEETGEENEGE